MDKHNHDAPATAHTISPADVARFWVKVDRTGDCWTWLAYRDQNGYGRFSLGGRAGRMEFAHRVAWAIANGEFTDGSDLDHLCRNRACVNPSHLEPVSHRENCTRGIAGAVNRERQLAITECPRGHAYDAANTGRRANGRRRCKTCDRDRARAYRAGVAA